MNGDLLKILAAMAEINNRVMSPATLELFLLDLGEYPVPAVMKSLTRCRKELTRFPTLADVIERIDDGRPGVEEAWAMLPKTEDASVVWTEEMMEAYSAMRTLMHDPVAARMAFKETYSRALSRSRDDRRPVKWTASLGHDKRNREAVLIEAVQKNRLPANEVKALLPELSESSQMPREVHKLLLASMK